MPRNFLSMGLFALSLLANLGSVGTAFASTADAPQAAPRVQQPSNASPYDSPDFVVPESNIFG